MADVDKSNITMGRPTPGGAIYWAPAGTALPTNASTPISTVSKDYVSLGYVTEDGLKAAVKESVDDIVEWGGTIVGSNSKSYKKTYEFALLETSRLAALQFRYGASNVTVDATGAIVVADDAQPLTAGVLVVDTLQTNGGASRIKRQVLGCAQLTDRSGDQTYSDKDPVNIPATVTAFPFSATVNGTTKDVYSMEYTSAAPAA